jgi:uncharacterized damage-inducible protein DinB
MCVPDKTFARSTRSSPLTQQWRKITDFVMNELQRILIANSVAAPPANILEAIPADLAHRRLPAAPHSIYEEVWHLAFWQSLMLQWMAGDPAPGPEHASLGFPSSTTEPWESVRTRFLSGTEEASEIARHPERLESTITCPSLPPAQPRVMLVRDQLESVAAHNTYHLGRIVLLRQLFGSWPPPSGGDTW